MSLDAWRESGLLVRHSPSRGEIAELLAIVRRDLRECRTPGLSPEWQLAIAYNAVLQAATAALASAGYRVRRREGAHHLTLESLAYTAGIGADVLGKLDLLRKKRHLSDYVRVGAVSQQEASEAVELVEAVCGQVLLWLRARYPHLAGDN